MFHKLAQVPSVLCSNSPLFGKLFSIIVVAVVAVTSLLSTTASAQVATEEDVKAEIVKNSALFTPELIQKADVHVMYDDEGNAVVLTSLDTKAQLTKEEKKLVKNAVKNYNKLSKKDKSQNIYDKKSTKEKFGHVSGTSWWLNWWGVRFKVDGIDLDNAMNNYTFLYTLSLIPVGAACSFAGPVAGATCAAILSATVAYKAWSLNWCKINRGYVYFDINPFNKNVSYFC
jgi:hypothetical protein